MSTFFMAKKPVPVPVAPGRPVTRYIAAPNPYSATAAPVVYEQAYGLTNINSNKEQRQHGRRGKRRMSPCMCRTLAIVGILCVFLTGVAIVVSLLVTGPDESTIALQIDATKMTVPYFEETNREKFRYYEHSFCSDIATIIENSYFHVEANLESCELKEIDRFLPTVYSSEFNVTGTSFTVFVVFTTGEKRPESTLDAIIDLLIKGAQDGTYRGYALPCFSQIDKISFPGVRDKEIVFMKDYCFNVELTNRTLEHNPKLSVDDKTRFLQYQKLYCNDVRRLFNLYEVSHSIKLDHCSLNATESYIEQGLWPPGTTFMLWIQVRRVEVVTETLLLYRLNQLLSKALLYNTIEHRPAFPDITSGQIIKCRRPKPPVTTTVAPMVPTTTGEDCEDTEITVPATEIIGVFKTNLDIDTGTSSNSTAVKQKIQEISYIRDIFAKCEAELNCIHPPVVYVISLGDAPGQELKFSIKITVVVSVKESPSEVAIIVASNVPKGYTRSVKQVTVTVPECEIVSCETFHGGCADACSTHECNQLLDEGFSCSCPNDQVLVNGDCVDVINAFPCFFDDLCIFELISGEPFHIGFLLTPDQESDEELVLSLDVTVTTPLCLAITYIFDTTCPEDNWISLENCWGYRYWNATYTLGAEDHVEIPQGATSLILRLRSRGPLVAVGVIGVTEGPCRRVRLVGGENNMEGVLEFNQANTWYPVCQQFDIRAFFPNLCHHLGHVGKWTVGVPADQFGERPPSDTYVSDLRCDSFFDQCSTASLVSCQAGVTGQCPNGLQAVRCADMEEEPVRALRLIGGYTTREGRIQVFYKGTWYSIAAESYHSFPGFDFNAETGGICRTLGYAPGFFIPQFNVPGYFGVPNVPGVLEYWEVIPPVKFGIQCLCGAKDLTECKLYEFDRPSFDPPLAVFCGSPITTPPLQQKLSIPQIQLVGSSDSLTAGRLELEVDGVIGTVCYGERIVSFPEEAQAVADVICRTLGYGDTGVAVVSQWGFGTRTGSARTYLEDLRCTGDEAHIDECSCAFLASSDCGHREDAALACGDAIDTVLNQVEARLLDEKQIQNGVRGVVEVRLLDFETNTYSDWGTVCDDGISYQEAGVICSMLGYSGGGALVPYQYCTVGTGAIHVDSLDCPYFANYLPQCTANPWGVHNCGHHEDLCISCTNEPISVRLERDPPNPFDLSLVSGRLMVIYGGVDGEITDDVFIREDDTIDILCSLTLGIPRAELAFSYALFFNDPNASRVRLLYNLRCANGTTAITDCQHAGWGSQSQQLPDATMHLFCFKLPLSSQVRVIGPQTGIGNIVAHLGGQNGVICTEGFTDAEAERCCQDLGFSYGRTMMGTRTQSIAVIEGIDCSQGSPGSIADCVLETSGDNPFCDAEKTAAVVCRNTLNDVVNVTVGNDGILGLDVNGEPAGALCTNKRIDDNNQLIEAYCHGEPGVIVQANSNDGRPCVASTENLIFVDGSIIITELSMGDRRDKKAILRCLQESDNRNNGDSSQAAISTPTPGDDETAFSNIMPRAITDCEYTFDCDPGTFDDRTFGILLAENRSADFSYSYDLPYESCACVNISKADRGSLVIIQSFTSSYTNFYLDQPFSKYVESSAIHSGPTVGYEEVCTTVKSFARPVLKFGVQSVDVYAIPVMGGTITIEDFKLYNGTCGTPPPDPNIQKCRSNNQYVNTNYLCDGQQDCLDGSDEKDCSGVIVDFETDPADWIDMSTGGVYFEIWKGETQSLYTGPNSGYANALNPVAFTYLSLPEWLGRELFEPAATAYLVMQAFRGAPGEEAVYGHTRPAGSGEGCVSFQYSLIGRDVDHLRVEVEIDGVATVVWQFNGQSALQFDDIFYQWRKAEITLAASANVMLVKIIGTRGTSRFSDIAIDELRLSDGACTPRDCLADLEFRCADGTCIPASFAFDAYSQCPDGSDLLLPPANNICLNSEYTCTNGDCITAEKVCDGLGDCFPESDDETMCAEVPADCMAPQYLCDKVVHCEDGADESGCTNYDVLNGPLCLPSQFELGTGECFPWNERCNGNMAAYDYTDEYDCPTCSQSRLSKCGPYCIDDSYICDGVSHCPDEDDEQPGCEALSTNILCDANSLLVVGRWICDMFSDCDDGSDEPVGCTCGLPRFYFECGDNCIRHEWTCDNFRDCADNSDETDCQGVCSGGTCTCLASEVACSDDSKCIPRASWCDGAPDCDDCSDEAACGSYQCDPRYQFTCNDGTCIAATSQNDGFFDCPSGEDEECSRQNKRCENGKMCYRKSWECDGFNDCEDLSDEAWCPCRSDQSRCANGVCYLTIHRCDGHNDCTDLSDEFDCQAVSSSCQPFQWRCLSADYGVTGCAPENKVCDRINNCLDQSDELFCLKDYQSPDDQCVLETADRCDGVQQCEPSITNNDETFCFTVDESDDIVRANGLPVCIENWDVSWMRFVCTQNRLGWYGARTEAIDPSPYGEFILLPPSPASHERLATLSSSTFACPSDPRIVKVNCPAVSCGTRHVSTGGQWDATNQVIGGHTTRRGEVPWLVAIMYNDRGLCSGTIIDKCWIATAGHCVEGNRLASKMAVVIDNDATGTQHQVARFILHPQYDGFLLLNDHALLQLEECLSFDDNVSPICLPYPGQDFLGQRCESAGSGRLSDRLSLFPDKAAVATFRVLDDSHCTDVFKDPFTNYDPEHHLCMGDEDGWTSTCNGDSGGPAYCSSKKDTDPGEEFYVLAGTTSYGLPGVCNGPSGMARVSFAVEWMIEQMEAYPCNCQGGCTPRTTP